MNLLSNVSDTYKRLINTVRTNLEEAILRMLKANFESNYSTHMYLISQSFELLLPLLILSVFTRAFYLSLSLSDTTIKEILEKFSQFSENSVLVIQFATNEQHDRAQPKFINLFYRKTFTELKSME